MLELPFGSFTVGQPPAVITINADLSNQADLDTLLPITATPGFHFGADALDNPTTDPPIIGSDNEADFKPILLKLTKQYIGPEDETASGPNFPRQYVISVDIANGQTIDNLQLKDILPNNLQYLQFDSGTPGSCTPSTEPALGSAHPSATNTVIVDCGSVTGTAGAVDATFTYSFFVPRPDANAAPVIDPISGDDVESIDDASANGNWTPIDSRDATIPVISDEVSDDHTLTDKSIAIQKSVANISDSTNSPTDVLSYTLDFQISDFFAFQNVVIDDIMSDGQRFDPSFPPTLSFNGNTYALTAADFDPANFTVLDHFTGGVSPTAIDGTQELVFRVSNELISRGQNGRMIGGCVPTTGTGTNVLPNCDTTTGGYNDSGTTGQIVFHTIIQNIFTDDYALGDKFVDQGDTLTNGVTIGGDVLKVDDLTPDGEIEEDTSGTTVTIPRGAVSKTIYAINGNILPMNHPNPVQLSADDVVTYRIQYDLPVSDLEDFYLTDYLPLPVFNVSPGAEPISGTFDTTISAATPPGGTAKFGPDDTFFDYSGITPAITNDADSNSVQFFYGDFQDDRHETKKVDILLSVTARNDPFADKLFLTNQVRGHEQATDQSPQNADAIIQIKLTEPVLDAGSGGIIKGIVATDNANAVFSGQPVPNGVVVSPPSANACSPFDFTSAANHSINSANIAGTMNADVTYIDSDDTLTYSIVIQNTGSGLKGAFDIEIHDDLPGGLEIPSGAPVPCVTNGAGVPLAYTKPDGSAVTSLSDLFTSGIELVDNNTDPTDPHGALGPGEVNNVVVDDGSNIAIITYNLHVVDPTQISKTYVNTAGIYHYATIEGGPTFVPETEDPVTHEITIHPITDPASATMVPQIDKTIIDTNQSFTQQTVAETDVAVGEQVQYQVVLTIPEGFSDADGDVTLVDTLDPGLAFVSLDSLTVSNLTDLTTDISGGFPAVLTTAQGGGFGNIGSNPKDAGRTLTLNFGTLTNTNRDNNTPETITLTYTAVVLNSADVAAGGQKTNAAVLSWVNQEPSPGPSSVSASAPVLTILEPALTIDKQATPTGGDAGDEVTFTITIAQNALANFVTDAFNLDFSDVVPVNMTYVPGSLDCSAGAQNFTCDDTDPAEMRATLANFTTTGGNAIISFRATLDIAVNPNQVLTNTANLLYTSLPGDVLTAQSTHNTLSVERTGDPGDVGGTENDYHISDSAIVTVPDLAPVKTVVATSEVNASSDPNVAIGEIVRYRLVSSIPEGTTPNLRIADQLPSGMIFLNDGTAKVAFVSDDNSCATNITSSTSLGTTADECGDETSLDGVTPTVLLPDDSVSSTDSTVIADYGTDNTDTYDSGSDIYFKLGTVINTDSDTNIEYVVIEFNALVDNHTDSGTNSDGNDDGEDLVNTATVRVGSSLDDGPTSDPATVTVVEPLIDNLTQTITSTGPYDAGDTVSYQITFSPANGNAPAYDVHLTDLLPASLTNLANIVVSSPGSCATGVVTTASTSTTLDVVLDVIPVNCVVTVTYTADVVSAAANGLTITNPAHITYTDLPGTGTPTSTSGSPTTNLTGSSTPGVSGADNGERDGSNTGKNDYFDDSSIPLTLSTPTIVKSLTNAAPTSFTIGNPVDYDLLVTLPEGTTTHLIVTDNVPDGLRFLGYEVVKLSSDSGTPPKFTGDYTGTFATPNPTNSGTGGDVALDFGDVVTPASASGANPDTANNHFIVRIHAVIEDVVGNQDGVTLTNGGALTYINPNDSTTVPVDGGTVPIDLIEPVLSIDKSIPTVTTPDAGNNVGYQIVIAHTSASDANAYDVVVSDTAPADVLITSIDSVTPTGGATLTLTSQVAITGGGAGLLTSSFDLPLGATVTINYTGQIQSSATPNEILTNTANVVWTSISGANVDERNGTSGQPYDDYTATDTATLTTVQSTLVKTIVATSETDTASSSVTIGEIVRYRLVTTLPEGTSPNLRLADQLPSGLDFFNDGTAKVAFISNEGAPGANITSSTLGTAPGLSGNAAAAPTFVLPDDAVSTTDSTAVGSYGADNADVYGTGDHVYFKLGNVVNNDSDSDAEYVVIEFNALVNNRATGGTGNNGNDSGETLNNNASLLRGPSTSPINTAGPVTVTVTEPSITNLDQTITSTGPYDAGDVVSYQVTFSNTGTSTAYDVHLTDALNANLDTYTFGSVTSAANCAVGATSNSTTALDVTLTSVPVGCSVTVTYTAQVIATAVSGVTINNTANVTCTSLPGANGTTGNATGTNTPGASGAVNGERDGSGGTTTAPNDYFDSDNAPLTLTTPLIVKSLTNAAPTSFTIGNQVDYDLLVTLPEGTTQALVVTDTIPTGLRFDSYNVITSAASSGGKFTGDFGGTFTTATPTNAGTGGNVSLNFGNTVTPATTGTANNHFIVRLHTTVTNVVGNQDGNTRTNSAALTYTDGTTGSANVSGGSVNVSLIEPDLSIDKTITAPSSPPDAGDTITYQIVIAHTANSHSPAYDAVVSDTAPTNVLITSITGVTATGGATLTTTGQVTITGGGTGLTTAAFDMPLASTVTITYTGTIQTGVAPNQALINNANVTWTSTSGANAEERNGTGTNPPNDYTKADTATITTAQSTLTKALLATSESGTTGSNLTIGEIARYRLVTTLPEGTSLNLRIGDQLPTGLTFLDDGTAKVGFVSDGGTCGANISSTTLSTTPGLCGNAGTETPTSVLPDNAVSAIDSTVVGSYTTDDSDTYATGTDLFFKLGDVTNNDSDANTEYVVIEFNALVDNTVTGSNDLGDTRANTATLRRGASSTNITTTAAVTVTVQEPSIPTLTQTITSTAPYDAGDTVNYSITFTNGNATNNSPAYDVNVTDSLPSTLTGVTNVVVTSTGTCIVGTVVDNSTSGALNVVIPTVPKGCAVTVTYTAYVVAGTDNGATITNNAEVTYTSLPGTNGTVGGTNTTGSNAPGVSGSDTGERNGVISTATATNTNDDYHAAGSVPLTLATPTIVKSLTTATPTSFTIGNQVDYDLLVTLPEGTTQALVVTDDIPTGLRFDSYDVITSAASSGGKFTGDFSGTFTTAAPTNTGTLGDVSLNFGDTVTAATAANSVPDTTNNHFIVRIHTTVTNVLGNQDPGTRSNSGALTYTNGTSGSSTNVSGGSVDISLIEPRLDLTKTIVGTATNLQAGDTVQYQVTIAHNAASHAEAYDVLFADTVPTGLLITSVDSVTPTGGATLTGSDVSITGGGTGLTSTSFDMPLASTVTVTYTATVQTAVTPTQTLTNNAKVVWTSTDGTNADERTSGDGVITSSTLNNYEVDTSVNATAANIFAIDKTASGNYTIGDSVPYSMTLSVMKGTTPGVIVTDTLPVGVTYVAGSIVVTPGSGITTGYVDEATSVVYNAGARTVTVTLGSVARDAADAGTGVTIAFNGLMANVTANQVDLVTLSNNVKTNSVTATSTVPQTSTDTADVSLIEPRIKTTKTITSPSPATGVQAGDDITYQVVLENTGNATAYDVVVDDTLPTGVLYKTSSFSCTTGSPTVTDNTTSIHYGSFTIAAGDSVTCTYTVTAQNTLVIGGTYTNTADADWTSESGTTNINERTYDDGTTYTVDGTQDTDTASFDSAPALTLDKSADVTDATIGDTITYTLSIDAPLGTVNALDIQDTLPTGTSYVASSYTITGISTTPTFTNVGTALEWAFSPSAVVTASPVTITYQAVVTNVTTVNTGDTLTNAATLDYNDAEDVPQPQLDDSTDVDVIEPVIALTKSITNPNPATGVVAGTDVTYQLVLENTGNATAYDVVVDDVLPAGVLYKSSTLTCDAGTVTASGTTTLHFGALTMAAGDTVTCSYTVTAQGNIVLGSTLTNTADADWSSQPGTDNPEDRNYVDGETPYGVDGDQDTDTASFTTPLSLDFSKADDREFGTIGDTDNYTLTMTSALGAVKSLVVVDTLPAGMIYQNDAVVTGITNPPEPVVSAPNDGSAAVTLTWDFGTSAVVTTSPVTFKYSARIANVISNQTTVKLTNTATLNYHNGNDDPEDQLSDSADVTIQEPEITTTKTITSASTAIHAGDTVSYEVKFENTGEVTAYEVTADDTLPTGVTYVSGSLDCGTNTATVTNATNPLSYGSWTIAVGSSVTCTYSVTADSDIVLGGDYTNTVDADWSSQPDADENPDDRSYDDGTTYTVDGTQDTDTATFDTDVTPTLTKSVDPASATIGDTVSYTLTIDDLPTGTVNELDIKDTLPTGMSYVASSQSVSGIDATNLTFTGSGTALEWAYSPSALVTGPVTITYDAVVTNDSSVNKGDTLTNAATVDYNDASDVPQPQLTDEVDVPVHEPIITTTKTITSATTGVQGGDTVTYSVKLENTGDATAYDVTADDTLPVGVTYNAASLACPPETAVVTNDANPVSYGSFTIAVGDSVTCTYTVTADSDIVTGADYVNTVDADWSSQPGTDNPDDRNYVDGNTPYVVDGDQDEDTAIFDTNVVPTLEKSVDVTSATIGNTVTYTLDITLPLGTVNELDIKDTLPTGMSYVASSQSVSGIDSTNLTFTGSGTSLEWAYSPSALVTGAVTITYNAVVTNDSSINQGDTLTNAATLDYENGAGDPQPQLTDEVDVPVHEPQITTTKTITSATTGVQAGDIVTYSVKLQNTGDATAYDVTADDTLPTGVTYNAASLTCPPETATVMNATNPVSYGSFTITAGDSVTCTYTVTADNDIVTGADYTNTVDADWSSQPGTDNPDDRNYVDGATPYEVDGDQDEDTATFDTNVTPTLEKSVDVTSATIGDTVTYTLDITLPLGTVNELDIKDTLPTGMSYVASSQSVSGIDATNLTFTGSGTALEWAYSPSALVTGPVTITYNAVVTNDSSINQGDTLTNAATLDYENGAGDPQPQLTDEVDVPVHEPIITTTKTITSTTTGVQAGDIVTYSVKLENTGDATAYDVTADDTLPVGVTYNAASLACPPETAVVTNATNPVSYGSFTIAAGDSVTCTYTVTADNDIVTGADYINTVDADWSSQPGTTNPEDRNYVDGETPYEVDGDQDTDTASFTTDLTLALDKTEDKTVIHIGETLTYTLKLDAPLGTVNNLVVTDTLPAGLVYTTGTAAVSGVTTAPTVVVTGTNDGTATVLLTWTFGNAQVTSSPITITYDVTAADVVGNTDGKVVTNAATADYTDGAGTPQPQLTDSVDVTIRSRGTITGYVYQDPNGDGTNATQPGSGDTAIPNVTVNLYDSSNNLVDTQVTDVNGYFEFDDLLDDTYHVVVDETDADLTGIDPDIAITSGSSANVGGLVIDVGNNQLTAEADFPYRVPTALAVSKLGVDLNGSPLNPGETVGWIICAANPDALDAPHVTIHDNIDTNKLTLVPGTIVAGVSATCPTTKSGVNGLSLTSVADSNTPSKDVGTVPSGQYGVMYFETTVKDPATWSGGWAMLLALFAVQPLGAMKKRLRLNNRRSRRVLLVALLLTFCLLVGALASAQSDDEPTSAPDTSSQDSGPTDTPPPTDVPPTDAPTDAPTTDAPPVQATDVATSAPTEGTQTSTGGDNGGDNGGSTSTPTEGASQQPTEADLQPLKGQVWLDVDGNGDRSDADKALSGVALWVFVDNGDGKFSPNLQPLDPDTSVDGDDNYLGTMSTDNEGKFQAMTQPGFSYWLYLDVKSLPDDADIQNLPLPLAFQVPAELNIRFAVRQHGADQTEEPTQAPQPKDVSAKLWLDVDNNGLRGPDDLALSGVRVWIFADNGDNQFEPNLKSVTDSSSAESTTDNFVKSATSDGNGNVSTSVLSGGRYWLYLDIDTLPAGVDWHFMALPALFSAPESLDLRFQLTPPTAPAETETPTDAPETATPVSTPPATMGTVDGRAWLDSNHNGRFDDGEALSGIHLWAFVDDGDQQFQPNVQAMIDPNAATPTTGDNFAAAFDTGDDGSFAVGVPAGRVWLYLDISSLPTVVDAGHLPLPVLTTAPGSVDLRFESLDGAPGATETVTETSIAPTETPAATDVVTPVATQDITPEVTETDVPVGTPEITPDVTETVVPIGTPESTPEATETAVPGNLTGHVWIDVDGDSVRTDADLAGANASIWVFADDGDGQFQPNAAQAATDNGTAEAAPAGDVFIQSITADANGDFSVQLAPETRYWLLADSGSLQPAIDPHYTPLPVLVDVPSDVDLSFPGDPALAATPEATPVVTEEAPSGPPVSARGLVYNDDDANRTLSVGETAIANVSVSAYHDNGDGTFDPAVDTLVGQATTGSDGYYQIDNLNPGRTWFKVDTTTLPQDYVDTFAIGDHGVQNPALITLVSSAPGAPVATALPTDEVVATPEATAEATEIVSGANFAFAKDTDGDGVPDAVEGAGDRDNDTIPNYLDPFDPQGVFYIDYTGNAIAGIHSALYADTNNNQTYDAGTDPLANTIESNPQISDADGSYRYDILATALGGTGVPSDGSVRRFFLVIDNSVGNIPPQIAFPSLQFTDSGVFNASSTVGSGEIVPFGVAPNPAPVTNSTHLFYLAFDIQTGDDAIVNNHVAFGVDTITLNDAVENIAYASRAGLTATVEATAQVQLFSDLNFTLVPNNSDTIDPGATRTYDHTLTNDGQTADRYVIHAPVSSQSWDQVLRVYSSGGSLLATLHTGDSSYTSPILQPGDTLRFELDVTVPVGTPTGVIDTTTITADSVTNPNLTRTVTDMTDTVATCISGRAYNDVNGDGNYDPGTDIPLSHAHIFVYDINQQTQGTVGDLFTDSNGLYTLDGLPAGTYRLDVDSVVVNGSTVDTSNADDASMTINTTSNNSSCSVASFSLEFGDPIFRKSASDDSLLPGDDLTYTLTVKNTADFTITSVTVRDPLSSYLDFNDADTSQGSWSFNDNNNAVTFELGNIDPGDTVTMKVKVTVSDDAPTDGTIRNQARLEYDEGSDVTASRSVDIGDPDDAEVTPVPSAGVTPTPPHGFPILLPVTGDVAAPPPINPTLIVALVVGTMVALVGVSLLAVAIRRFSRQQRSQRSPALMVAAVVILLVGLLPVAGVLVVITPSGDGPADDFVMPTLIALGPTATEQVIPPTAIPPTVMALPTLLPTQDVTAEASTPEPTPEATADAAQSLADWNAQFQPPGKPATQILIPVLGVDTSLVEAKIVGTTWDVSPFYKEVAHLEGTAFPGTLGNAVVAAHVTTVRGAGPFRHLDELKAGDLIIAKGDGVIYRYVVTSTQVVGPDDISVTMPTDGANLTLLTCTDWDRSARKYTQRLVVHAVLEPGAGNA